MTKKTNTKLSFIGLGYVGLTTSICFSNKGFHVIGVDVDKMVYVPLETIEEVFDAIRAKAKVHKINIFIGFLPK